MCVCVIVCAFARECVCACVRTFVGVFYVTRSTSLTL